MGNKNSADFQGMEAPPPHQHKTFDLGSIKPDFDKGELLGHVPLLAKFSKDERACLGGVLEDQEYHDKDVIIRQGDWGHGFYIIKEGKALVQVEGNENKTVVVGALERGDYFGEAALINESRRGATVIANGPLKVFYLDRAAFAQLFTPERLNVQFAKRNAISAEMLPEKRYSMEVAPVNAVKEKSAPVRKTLVKAVRSNLLFQGLARPQQEVVVDEMWRLEVKQGDVIIRQGDRGDNFYVVESGNFDIFVQGPGEDEPRKVATRGKETCFGELALMYNTPREATVRATENSIVWAVDRFTFRRILANVSDEQLRQYCDFLSQVDLLAPLSNRERMKIAEALDEAYFRKGDVIVKQGEKGDTMYIVRSGEAICSIDGDEVKRYRQGDYFGERALLKDSARSATVTAATNLTLLQLDRNAFSLLLGPLEDIMKKRVDQYDRENRERKQSDSVISRAADISTGLYFTTEEATHRMTSYKMRDLKVLGILGKGSFGVVKLVKAPDGKTYALKAVSKQQTVETGQQSHVMNEKKAMLAIDHPFCIKLFQTFKDQHLLYFLLEPSLGGELFTILRARTFFPPDTARFYAAQVVLVFEYMHARNIIYRDLKPENLLLDKDGYIKITDFGFAKVVTGRTYTLCGTPDYLSPEIVAGKGHGKGVDWWTLGILIFEMLASYPPFYDTDPMKTYAKIMHGKVVYPSHFSKEAEDLISKLLQPKPTRRLGVIKGGAEIVRSHPWFQGIDWEALLQRKLKAPILPKVRSAEDLSNFGECRDREDHVIPYQDNGTNWEADF